MLLYMYASHFYIDFADALDVDFVHLNYSFDTVNEFKSLTYRTVCVFFFIFILNELEYAHRPIQKWWT